MMEIARRKPVVVLKVVDADGRAIGEVMHPRVAPIVGRGARTVLLVRDQRLGRTQLRAT